VAAALVVLVFAGILVTQALTPRAAEGTEVTVYTTPTCGCCRQWAARMEDAGFTVNLQFRENMAPIKAQYGVEGMLQACHTAVVNDYVVEGHVPPETVHRMLLESPVVTGIAVPGMPMGSPGMEQGGMRDRFNVVAFDRNGGTSVYAQY